ncbi:caspase-8-like isoform X3 [Chiloscyllium plagiosum]|uniref:caspase-8-like isoform X3 n=1 Tax=Chiloscyllium plagiosum TaxID=36176 RepID=UPI001CB81633|nr:caspase-8-like isoform X3 [Chiloscyllium plagiosum]
MNLFLPRRDMPRRLEEKMDVNSNSLYEVSMGLDKEELGDLKFLCTDHLQAGKGIASAQDLFRELQQQDLDIIPELLYQIQRFDLLNLLGKRKADMEHLFQQPENSKISDYRVLLYNISKEINGEELSNIKFILQVAKGKSQDMKNFMDVCINLERKGQLAPDNLYVLLNVMKEIKRIDLKRKLEKIQDITATLPQQESRSQAKEPNHGMFPGVSCQAQTDAKPSDSTGTENQHEPQPQTSTVGTQRITVDDPAVEKPCPQQGGGSTTEYNLHSIGNLHTAVEKLRLESTSETSRTSSVIATSSLPQHISTQTSSQSDTSQTNSQQCIEVYKMNSEPLGICLILNNKLFPGTNLNERKGTDCDAEKLTQVFKMLGFNIVREDNLTVKRMEEVLLTYQTFDHNDCFVCCILSHGEKDAVVGTDGELLPIKKIRSMFSGSQCCSLLEKPKVFFIQACQGQDSQRACQVMNYFTSSSSELETDAMTYSIPEDRDFLIGMSTVADCVSYRTHKGSWFIQELCNCLEELCPRGEDLLTILTVVNQKVSEKHQSKKQIPEPRFTLSKKLIILPPSKRNLNS